MIDLDIKGFFDAKPHDLMMRALKRHAQEAWVELYVQRWLEAPMQSADGEQSERKQGTPQGGVISPLRGNLFLHYAFDMWMHCNHSSIPFERYADEGVVHCRSLGEAQQLLNAIGDRFMECGLELHPGKTKIVYCQDANRSENGHPNNFDFLGYCFWPRLSKNRHGKYFVNFSPAISLKEKKDLFEH